MYIQTISTILPKVINDTRNKYTCRLNSFPFPALPMHVNEAANDDTSEAIG